MDRVRAVVLIIFTLAIVIGFMLKMIDASVFMPVAAGAIMWLFGQVKGG